MTAIGTLSIVLGMLGMLLAGLIFFGGHQIDRNLDSVERSLEAASDREYRSNRAQRQASRTGDELRRAEELIVPDGIVSAGLSAWLLLMGIGTLRMKWWARWGSILWSVACIAFLSTVIVLRPVDFSIGSWLILLYPLTLLVSFMRPSWRAVYRRAD